MSAWDRPQTAESKPLRRRSWLLALVIVILVAGVLVVGVTTPAEKPVPGAATGTVSILSGEPSTFDPAGQSDVGTAAVTAQIYESLTAFDPKLVLRPALAGSWDVLDGGRRVVFHLRPGLAFSDGTPITAADVVRSWLRVIDPARPSPLASLMGDVVGANDYLHRVSADPATVGVTASGSDVEVRLSHPASEFPAIVASPTFGIIPKGTPDGKVASGGYALRSQSSDEVVLQANTHYWAGSPAIATVRLVTSLGGASPLAAFVNGDIDYTGLSGYDAAWVRYDPNLGPSLRTVPSLSLQYLGFDVRQKPFDDVRVRKAFALAVDWARLVNLASLGTSVPATSMVPPGIQGRSDRDLSQRADPARAKALLAEAGYPGGAGFPSVTYVSGGSGIDAGILKQLKDVLGITIKYETMDFSDYFPRLHSDPPAMWSLGWVADYPGPNDFLGVLLGTGQSNNYGHWTSPEFDAAIADAGAATDPATILAAYERAETVVQRDAPAIPLSNGSGWALARKGLLGASDNGLGFIRLAGLAWAP
ncbi:MAG: peptide ABC transporter substrate-binding protein [Chloroflexota bacterium]|nr:peptide ABC transporter substrate-binding protein [Chloroflexota bacterium]